MGTKPGIVVGDRLVVTLEDAASRSRMAWLTGLRGGTQTWHFVGLLDGQPAYDSPSFAAPYSWGILPMQTTAYPREEWAPGMTEALDQLCIEIAADGWTEVGHGQQPWEHVFRRAG